MIYNYNGLSVKGKFMNKKKLIIWELIGVIVIFALGAVWHFVFAKVPYKALGVIFPVNESPWEHVKLFFFPAIIFYAIQYFAIGKEYKNYIFAHGVSLVFMPVVMFAMFYGYRLLLNIDEKLLYDIIITFVVMALGSLLAYKITVSEKHHGKKAVLVFIIATVMLLVQAYFTFFPIKAPLFYDKNENAYGILEEYSHEHE